ncbi:hypothetical protein I5168_07020 [Nonlabens sp. SCSIO 43208]|uniref:hypothetical protein n=1 Tax=Nonlabens sp. SCSIO 43208 TaxID=2793009 RepID=UPI003D6B33E8
MKNFLRIFVLVLLITSCEKDSQIDLNLLHRIPHDSKIIIDANNMEDVFSFIENNALYNQIKNLDRLQEIKNAGSFLELYKESDNNLITVSIEGKNEVVISLISSDLPKYRDTTSTFNYNETKYYKSKTDSIDFYFLNHKGLHLASSSKLIIESQIRRELDDYVFNDEFKSLYEKTSGNSVSLYVKASDRNWLKEFIYGRNINDKGNYAHWYQVEPENNDLAIQFSGILTYSDSTSMRHALYDGLTARTNHISEILPLNFTNVETTTYKNHQEIISNLSRQKSINHEVTATVKNILDNCYELSKISWDKEHVVAFGLEPYETFFLNLDSLSTAKFEYRNTTIYELREPINTSSLSPILPQKNYSYITVLGSHFILSEKATTPEQIIAAITNKSTLADQIWWQDLNSSINSSSSYTSISSIEFYKQNSTLSKNDSKILKQISSKTYPFIISQYVHENEYAHYNFHIPVVNDELNSGSVQQSLTYKSGSSIIAGPFLFPNHLTKGYDVAFQDAELKLHLVSDKGKRHWSKQLKGKILGEIQVVDGYKNGRKQLVFTTEKAIYYLDRNGKDVNKYPLEFKNGIDQPVSVFDYDNSRNYRFVVTQGSRLFMYDINGNAVKGFNYQPDGEILTSPQHIRVNNKDFIAFAKAENKIALISRTGKTRTKVTVPIALKGKLKQFKNKLVGLDQDGKFFSINPLNGEVAFENFNKYGNSFDSSKSQRVSYNDNNLFINKNKVEIPYGSYEYISVYENKNKSFISLVDNAENKVYIFSQKGDLLNGFPVYGNTTASVKTAGKWHYLVTLDGDDVLLYKW